MKNLVKSLAVSATMLFSINTFAADASCVAALPTVAPEGLPLSPAKLYEQFLTNFLQDPNVVSYNDIKAAVAAFVAFEDVTAADQAAIAALTEELQYSLGCGFATGKIKREVLMAWATEILGLVYGAEPTAENRAKMLPLVTDIKKRAVELGL